MGHINKIYEALLNRKGKICHKSGIIGIVEEYKKKFRCKLSTANAFKYLSRHNYIKRVFQSYYYLNSVDERKRNFCYHEDKELLFLVLKELKIKWYVGLNSAWYLAGKSWSVPRVLHILNTKFSGERRILSLKVKFVRIKDSLFFGLKKGETAKGIDYFYSTPTKTNLDMVYLGISEKLIRNKEIKKYLKYYPKWMRK